jgi:hypothetical protein
LPRIYCGGSGRRRGVNANFSIIYAIYLSAFISKSIDLSVRCCIGGFTEMISSGVDVALSLWESYCRKRQL